ncbi:TetR/AcrR family transcriptional regulator [Dactylosporangium matsuzakiense]|uniref:TetR family transcriptional regulator n=1 Tax=Dactylosporangium matsuzakiense TaxID=53360 RepID=A0A9W6KJH8_9ACTN|nr:TetR/AcrR family transcriptional regulator [Dactylosporangium matsuzakiense]UWZ41588.1 TetR/AcrR family transcriptional regulator [Dactylosporangium matsuzakiense]GLL02343.1 TetR family transcriptional regulator [Dactylosporangium matsuzakiense]
MTGPGTKAGPVAERGRRLEPDKRRAQILSCAVRLFGERPYADVSTSDIAEAAGVARGLINHYFGTKRDLYIEAVRILVTIPAVAVEQLPVGDRATRIDASVTWFLDVVSRHSRSWLAAVDAGDPDVRRVLAEADEVAAQSILTAVGLADTGEHRAVMRAYCGLAKATAREWLERGALDRERSHAVLATTLTTLVRDIFR